MQFFRFTFLQLFYFYSILARFCSFLFTFSLFDSRLSFLIPFGFFFNSRFHTHDKKKSNYELYTHTKKQFTHTRTTKTCTISHANLFKFHWILIECHSSKVYFTQNSLTPQMSRYLCWTLFSERLLFDTASELFVISCQIVDFIYLFLVVVIFGFDV